MMDRFVSRFAEKGKTGAQMLAIESDDEIEQLGMADVDCHSICSMHYEAGIDSEVDRKYMLLQLARARVAKRITGAREHALTEASAGAVLIETDGVPLSSSMCFLASLF